MGMHVDYYHLSPVILNDDIFFRYNELLVTTGTADQRAFAYLQAEQQMMRHLRTFLTPTTVTGTWSAESVARPTRLDHGYVTSIDRIVARSLDGTCDCDLTENTACALIRAGWGMIDFRVVDRAVKSGCGAAIAGPYYDTVITYTAGLPTGTAANDTSLHMALAKAAFIALNEVCDPGANEGGVGDPGIESYSSKGYTEKRGPLEMTSFGYSALANYITRLVAHLKKSRPLRFS